MTFLTFTQTIDVVHYETYRWNAPQVIGADNIARDCNPVVANAAKGSQGHKDEGYINAITYIGAELLAKGFQVFHQDRFEVITGPHSSTISMSMIAIKA